MRGEAVIGAVDLAVSVLLSALWIVLLAEFVGLVDLGLLAFIVERCLEVAGR